MTVHGSKYIFRQNHSQGSLMTFNFYELTREEIKYIMRSNGKQKNGLSRLFVRDFPLLCL
jgi:hypothetical protein